MPLVTLTVRKPTPAARKSVLFDAVHQALVASGVPATDLFQRCFELSEEDFRFDPSYPDAASPRTAGFALIEILLSVGRSVKIKRKILADIMAAAQAAGLNPEHVMVVFKETQWENWAFAGGRQIHA